MTCLNNHLSPQILLWGSLALSFNASTLEHLCAVLRQHEENFWLADVLKTLPHACRTVLASIPANIIHRATGDQALRLLRELEELFRGNRPIETAIPLPLPNSVLLPLVVIAQLAQYCQYRHQRGPEAKTTQTLGLCTGLLSAFAVSSSQSTEELHIHGAAAVRLGLLIGLMVDSQDASLGLGRFQSLSAAWSTPEGENELADIIRNFPHAYISVYYDEKRATVTSAPQSIPALVRRLESAGIAVSEIGLYGRFHSADNEGLIDSLTTFCDCHAEFQLPDASTLRLVSRSNNSTAAILTDGSLHVHALRAILVESSQWYQAFSATVSANNHDKRVQVLDFGPERSIPPSLAVKGRLNMQVLYLPDQKTPSRTDQQPERMWQDNDIAVVGMACKVPGANSIEEFWELLLRGQSQHQEIGPGTGTSGRFYFGDTQFRTSADPNMTRKWFANLIDGHDQFDHRFFKKSARESAAMDPQQRHILQVAYQALEQSGYFQHEDENRDTHVGCFIGACLNDYENNVACHIANAFTATGNLQGFLSGKISHFFGWTGPGLTINTACSSSLVAVHQACQAILAGDCVAALAGGSHILTSAEWFQNLAAGSFLSPTGQCKPFDEKADGYCRGEGVGAVVLKRMSRALADGDSILGVIAATAVQQNQNCSPIFVPNTPSLSDLFTRVMAKAGVTPSQISVVEAHGTGTAVGDPAEYGSIRKALGGSHRGLGPDLMVSSCTSGIMSLIKGALPPQGSFTAVSTALEASPEDRIFIPTQDRPWQTDFRAALINNYGASGSNASAVVVQAPIQSRIQKARATVQPGIKYPFWISGSDNKALHRNAQAFQRYLAKLGPNASLANVSFNSAHQGNRTLGSRLIFAASSSEELDDRLKKFAQVKDDADRCFGAPGSTPNLILCFGGQTSSYVGLDTQVYENVAIFRLHLDHVDAVAQSLGSITNIVELQVMLFAVQYACARSWLDSKIKPSALLTALCISEVLTVEDTLKMIVRRSTLVRDRWGPDKGDLNVVTEPASIACYNGPRSFTVAGPVRVIDASLRCKKLNVTNAFHSVLVDQSAEDLVFHRPKIPIEFATEGVTDESKLTGQFVADHMPVMRLKRRYGSSQCVFLEAGTNSTITSMAAHALAGAPGVHSFHAVNIANCEDGWNRLTESIVSLWKLGLNVQHWAHHKKQSTLQVDVKPLFLPPYQFDPESRHWMTLKSPIEAPPATKDDPVAREKALAFVGYTDGSIERQALFEINTTTEKYKQLLNGHVTIDTAPILSATLQIGFVLDGIGIMYSGIQTQQRQPQIHDVEYVSPVCANGSQKTYIEISPDTVGEFQWTFKVFSRTRNDSTANEMLHTKGKIALTFPEDSDLRRQLIRFERLFQHARALDLLESPRVTETLANRTIYRIFSDIVDYGAEFRGLQKLTVQGNETAGHIIRLSQNPRLWFDPHLADTFCQLGGLWINCFTDRDPGYVYLANGIDQWLRAHPTSTRVNSFHAYAVHQRPSEQASLTDVFVFNGVDGTLVEVILGISYVKIPKASMTKLLTSLTEPSWLPASLRSNARPNNSSILTQAFDLDGGNSDHRAHSSTETGNPMPGHARPEPLSQKCHDKPTGWKLADVTETVKGIIAELSGLDVKMIGDNSMMADLGIDSLAGMEMIHEIESALRMTLPQTDVLQVVDMPSLMACIIRELGIETMDGDTDEPSAISSFDEDATDHTSSSMSSAFSESYLQDELEKGSETNLLSLLPFENVTSAFSETKRITDSRIEEMGDVAYVAQSLPLQNQLTVALTIETFEKLGAGFHNASSGTQLSRIPHRSEHKRFVAHLYKMLETETQIIKIDDDRITRTAVPLPGRHSKEIYKELLSKHSSQQSATELIQYAGHALSQVLMCETDGVKLLFGQKEGRDLLSRWYAEWPLNRALITQVEDLLSRLCETIKRRSSAIDLGKQSPLRVLEMGAGTGGTTKRIVPLLAQSGIPVEYTFTDLSPSLVATARKTFGKQYPWMTFRTHDIEKEPEEDLEGRHHIVIASNAIHATKSLCVSTANVRKALRSDGLLVMIEMTRPPWWVDLIFGMFEGWWLFEDQREHALVHEAAWKKHLQAAGYGYVAWTDGDRPETQIQKVILAAADTATRHESISDSRRIPPSADCAAREVTVSQYVQDLTQGFEEAMRHPSGSKVTLSRPTGRCVLITGGTGGLGAHLVAEAALRGDVAQVICLNRSDKRQTARPRQIQALLKRGIVLPFDAQAKIQVFEASTDMARSKTLGLTSETYQFLVKHVTHIVHNAWLMHAKWPVRRFEPQLRIMAHLLELSGAISCQRPKDCPVSFQFISSIATVGHHPIRTNTPIVLEDRVNIDSVLPTGYGDAKYICERMVDATLHRHPERFRATIVRLGQIAGSTINGYWNPFEHVPFLLKSSQTLGVLPDLPGTMGWTPADDIARGLLEILCQPETLSLYPVYHIENPVRQRWAEVLAVIAVEMGISQDNSRILPFSEWIDRVKHWPRQEDNNAQGANPAYLLVDFLESNFIRMSCGGLLMGTAKAREHSPTLARLGPVDESLIRRFVRSWRKTGFLA
ncbi:uncharacterized protein BO95DRAFT_474176 [Aspergillus brunneoviolaceus CBS 621.78]|uniref:Uncharacterized protein n=1 Tax=Aspergillus brunneoviolaceus CBS 621.78 TaxID=1450534 RepID=A0ACD1G698_9EURO|nr:hypothetical protein BO95DRAFT_474176 [Aspergillus brunneoviolaceus CBS 621.78]RAH44773.1 hypothetical protein BO95DRAFT_474176 [Aspergillus brunneoviolaceus CBS 621.78]